MNPLVLIILVLASATHAAEPDTTDPLQKIGARASTGANPGYTDDKICGTCHQEEYQSFQRVGMAQSFSQAGSAEPIEEFGVEYFHALSDRYYVMQRNDNDIVFRRYQRDANQRLINEVQITVDWVIGSGNRARSYIYQTELGEMFLLPISWYSESRRWRMSPGYEFASHDGIQRQITRECMFCHNAYPELPVNGDAHSAPAVYPESMPQGIGCQRCHGPGAVHIRKVLLGEAMADVRAAISNPAKLAATARDSVCFQCHLLPSASVMGPRRLGRNDFSFRPSELLSDFLVHVDVGESGVRPGDRFEINHHGYRLVQSACYQQSAGELACISCHDPHVKPDSQAFRRATSAVCSQCHEDPLALHTDRIDLEADTCADCHMPRRRTGDVREVTMTDHKISTGPHDRVALVRPIASAPPPVSGIGLLDFGNPPVGPEENMYRFIAAIRSNRFVEAAELGLEQHLRNHGNNDPTPGIDLARAQIRLGKFAAAENVLRPLIRSHPDLAVGYALLGMSLLGQNQAVNAIDAFQKSLQLQSDPEVHFNLAATLLQLGDNAQASRQLDYALELRPLMAKAWKYKGLIHRADQEMPLAIHALQRALELEPREVSIYADLIELLQNTGDEDTAIRYAEIAARQRAIFAPQ